MALTVRGFLRGIQQVLLAPLLVGGVAALALYLLGMVPGYFPGAQEGAREYNTVEEASAGLEFTVAVPTYFPSNLVWPPASIRGEKIPVPRVQMVFLAAESRAPALLIVQIASESEELPVALPWMTAVAERMPVTLRDGQGTLVIGRGEAGQVINAIYWRAGGFYFVLVTDLPVEELLALARSMRP